MTDETTTDEPDEQDTTDIRESDDEHQTQATGNKLGPMTTRRGVLMAGSVLGLLGIGAGTASADPSGQVGSSSDPLTDLYTETLHGYSGTLTLTDTLNLDGNKLTNTQSLNGSVTGNTEITDLVGSGLTINSGSLAATSSAAWGDGSDNSNLLEPTDGSKTGIEDVTQIRSNGSVTVDIDADDSTTNSETFTVQADRDGTATTALSVDENAFVGINTDSPKQQLDISAANGDYIRFDGDFGHILQHNASSSQYWTLAPRNSGKCSIAVQGTDPGTGVISDSNDVLTFQSGGEIDVQSGPLDLNGNKLTNTQSLNGSVTGNTEITDLVGSGLTISSGSLQTSGSSKWADGSTASLLKPSDGGDTGIEGITQIRSNTGLTVDIDADANAVSEKFIVRGDKDGSSTDLLTVDSNTGNLDVHGSEVSNVAFISTPNPGDSLGISGPIEFNSASSIKNGLDKLLDFDVSENVILPNGDLDVQGGTVENTTGGLTVTTNDKGNLTLDPGSNNELQLSNQSTSSSGNLLAIDGSGNVKKASSTTLSDVGGSPSSLVTSSNSVTAVEVIDGSSSVSASSDTSTPPNVIGGHPSNNTGGYTVKGVTIAGGGGNSAASNDNTAGHNWATIGGGKNNTVKNAGGIIERGATIGGGIGNTTDSSDAPTVGGGQNNTAARKYATVAGGKDNKAGDTAGTAQTVGGGRGNEAIGSSATIPGGFKNRASGASSFAAGNRAVAADIEAFVWNDGTKYSGHSNSASGDGGFNSSSGVNGSGVTGANTFSVSASSGVRFVTGSSSVTYIPSGSTGWSTSSSRAFKTNIDPVDTERILDGVTEMEVATWEYEDDDGEGQGVTHIGPMAEDFHDIVDVGSSDEHINSLNADGMAFAAIQGLATKLDATRADIDAKDARIENQQDRIEHLESKVDNKDVALDALREALDDKDQRIADLEAESADLREENEQLRERNADLEDRLATVEAELGIDATASQQGVADD